VECITVSVKDAVRLTGLPRTTIYSLVRDGTLKSLKVGRRRLITTESIREFVASRVGIESTQKLKLACTVAA